MPGSLREPAGHSGKSWCAVSFPAASGTGGDNKNNNWWLPSRGLALLGQKGRCSVLKHGSQPPYTLLHWHLSFCKRGGGDTHASVCVLGATREVSTGTLFLNLNNAHHEFSGGKLCAEGKDGGHAWVSLHQSPLPAKTTYWWHSRGKASSE